MYVNVSIYHGHNVKCSTQVVPELINITVSGDNVCREKHFSDRS